MPETGRKAPRFAGPADRALAIFAAFDAKNIEALSALMTDDVRLQLGNSDVVAGKTAFRDGLQAFFDSVSSFRHGVTDVWHDGDVLVAEIQVQYTRLDGAEVTLPCCNVFRLRDGLVSDYRVYMDINPVYA